MKKSIILILVFICSHTFSQNTFHEIYQFGDSRGYGIQQTSDSGYISTISCEGYPNILMRLDALGNFIWAKEITPFFYFYNVIITSDGGYLISGESYTSQNYPCVVKTDSSGDTLWCRKFNQTWSFFGKAIEANSGYVLFGETYLFKIDLGGNVVWTRSYSYDLTDINLTPDGGYILTANDGYDLVVIKTDSLGDTLWTKKFSNGQPFHASAIPGMNNTFIIGGTVHLNPFLIKTNLSGDTLWTKQYTGTLLSSRISLMTNTNDDIIMFEGDWPDNLYLLKTDSSGNPLWGKVFGSEGIELGSAKATYDQGFIFTAAWYSGGLSNDAVIIKLDSMGNGSCVDTSIFPIATNMSMNVSCPGGIMASPPNTASYVQLNITNSTNYLSFCNVTGTEYGLETFLKVVSINAEENPVIIGIDSDKKSTVNLRMIDITGKILNQSDFNLREGFNSVQWLTGSLFPGIYFLTMNYESEMISTKFIVKQ